MKSPIWLWLLCRDLEGDWRLHRSQWLKTWRVPPNGIAGELSWFFSAEYWERGFATALGQGSIEYGLTNLRLARILATTYRTNRASVRVRQKLGMRQVRADEDEVEYEVKEG